jgi:hypothetical protein
MTRDPGTIRMVQGGCQEDPTRQVLEFVGQ